MNKLRLSKISEKVDALDLSFFYKFNRKVIALNFNLEKQNFLETYKKKYPQDKMGNLNHYADNIISSDPTTNKQYVRWLFNLALNKKLPTEDLYKATDYLTLFNKLVNRKVLPEDHRDIYKYKSLSELSQILSDYQEKPVQSENEKKSETKNRCKVFSSDSHTVYIPQTVEDSKTLGVQTGVLLIVEMNTMPVSMGFMTLRI